MIINKYYVFVPQDAEQPTNTDVTSLSEQEAQRQQALKQAQQQGGL